MSLYAAVARGQAIQCTFQQEEVDIIIPVILNAGAKLAEDNISAILIQVRNRTSIMTMQPLAANVGLFGSKSTPYISILFQFGLKNRNPAGKETKYTQPAHC